MILDSDSLEDLITFAHDYYCGHPLPNSKWRHDFQDAPAPTIDAVSVVAIDSIESSRDYSLSIEHVQGYGKDSEPKKLEQFFRPVILSAHTRSLICALELYPATDESYEKAKNRGIEVLRMTQQDIDLCDM